MLDQITIGTVASYDEYEASMKERKISEPKKKSIKETVPFSNVTYDFSAINGEVYWEERELDYVFEITANTPEELEEKRQKFMAWVMNVQNEKLYDPFIEDYHFLATFDSVDVDDSEIEKATINVTFTAYPYKIKNEATEYTVSLAATIENPTTVYNGSSHRITPTFESDVAFTIQQGDTVYSVPAGETVDDSFKLAAGANALILKADASGTVKISFVEEVF